MRLTELIRSRQWPSAAVEDGLSGMLAPTPVVVEGELFLVVGRRSSTGSSSLWALRVRADLGDAELLPLPIEGPLPEYCREGLVPTDARCAGGRRITVLFSGFRMMGERFQLLTGTATGDVGGILQVQGEPLMPPVRGQDVVRAGATFALAPGRLVYAAGSGWTCVNGRWHPQSHLRSKLIDPGAEEGTALLRPAAGEFALTRPVEFAAPGGDLVLFSRRLLDGTYIQGLARRSGPTGFVRADEELRAAFSSEEPFMYVYPFRWQERLLAVAALSRVGAGGAVVFEVEELT